MALYGRNFTACIVSILLGEVEIDEVAKIFTYERARDIDDWEHIVDERFPYYFKPHGTRDEAIRIVRTLAERSAFEQRHRHFPLNADTPWAGSPEEVEWEPCANDCPYPPEDRERQAA